MRLIIIFFLYSISNSYANNGISELADNYLNAYSPIAVDEMQRTGIPASIKLAQGLLESDWGRSDLATTANNHFGIKCGAAWDGGTFYKEDDDKNEKGKLIESCFRAFLSVDESYRAHSAFLTDPKKKYRYGFLFDLPSTDYKGWAHGLKKSGYATDPAYPQKLINIIEKYELHRFDTVSVQHHRVEKDLAHTVSPEKVISKKKDINNSNVKSTKNTTRHNSMLAYPIQLINDCRMVRAHGGETVEEIANKVGLASEEIIMVNEIYTYENEKLEQGAIVYIEKKKRKYSGTEEFHIVQEGETMETIAQLYGIRLRNLYAKNRMPKNSKTFAGVKLSLQKTISLDDRPQFKLDDDRGHKLLFADDDTIN